MAVLTLQRERVGYIEREGEKGRSGKVPGNKKGLLRGLSLVPEPCGKQAAFSVTYFMGCSEFYSQMYSPAELRLRRYEKKQVRSTHTRLHE